MLDCAKAKHEAAFARLKQEQECRMQCAQCNKFYDGRKGRAMFCTTKCEAAFGALHGMDDVWPCAFSSLPAGGE